MYHQIALYFQVTQKVLRSSLMTADCCRNMWEPVYRIKQWCKSVHCVGYFYCVLVHVNMECLGIAEF
jgi:hypothetical protein